MFWYHAQTKHSYNSVRMYPNQLSWEDQPSTYKNYPESYKKRKLDRDNAEDDFLYHIAGLTAKKSYPNELYFQARGVENVEDGIYHYEVNLFVENDEMVLYALAIGK